MKRVRRDREKDDDEEISIPKIVHHIWLGSPLPDTFRRLREQWMATLGNEWTFRLWDDDAVRAFGLTNRKAFDRAKNYGEKADIARYEILHRHGGVYLDTDMQVYKSLDDAPLRLHHTMTFYAGIANTGTVELNNAMIASRPGHPILQACIREITTSHENYHVDLARLPPHLRVMNTPNLFGAIKGFLPPAAVLAAQSTKPRESVWSNPMYTIARTGPGMFTRCVMSFLLAASNGDATSDDASRACVFPPTYFYPFPNNLLHLDLSAREAFRRPESICTHHWAATWNKHNASARKHFVSDEAKGWDES